MRASQARPLAVLLLLWTTGFSGFASGDAGDQTSAAMAADASVAVELAPVKQAEVGATIEAFGALVADPDFRTSLTFPKTGFVQHLWVRLGQRVKRGERLLALSNVPEGRAQFVQARAALHYARAKLARKKRLHDESLATNGELDTARQTLADAEAGYQALIKRGLDKSLQVLHAPVAGVITQLKATAGQGVSADATALIIDPQSHLLARLGVDPAQMAKLRRGLSVTLTNVFDNGHSVESQLTTLGAMVNPNTHLVNLDAPLPAKASWLPGARVAGAIHLPSHQALLVPRSAVLRDDSGDYLFRVQGGHAHRVAVTPGIEQGQMLEVRGDLTLGDKVVAQGNYELSDGMAVREGGR